MKQRSKSKQILGPAPWRKEFPHNALGPGSPLGCSRKPEQNYVLFYGNSDVWHSRLVCCVIQQTCLLRDTADMSTVPHSKHVCCATQQTCLLCHEETMSAAWHSGHVCCETQQTRLFCDTARHLCCVTQQTCLLCDTGGMSAVRHSIHAHPCLRHKTMVFALQEGGGDSPSSDTKPRFCVAQRGGICESSISTPALHQKLRIGQTSTVDYNQALGMGLGPKLKVRDPIFNKQWKVYSMNNQYTYIYIYQNPVRASCGQYLIELYYGIILQDYITELYNGIILRDKLRKTITGLYYGIISWDYIKGLYCWIILQNNITGLYYGIILQNYITGWYYGILIRDCITG